VVWLVTGTSLGRADSKEDERLVEGLQQRRLFDLAESVCRSELDGATSVADEAAWTARLIRVLTVKAGDAPRPEQPKVWQSVEAVAQTFRDRHTGHSYGVLVEFQSALAKFSHGVWQSEASEISSAPTRRERATRWLRDAIRDLRDLDALLVDRLQMASVDRKRDEERMTDRDLRTLRAHVRLQLSTAYLNQSNQFLSGSPDQVHVISRALDQLDNVAHANLPPASIWNAMVLRVVCLRYKRDFAGAIREIERISQLVPPTSIAQQLAAERVHSELDGNRVDQAISAVEIHRAENLPPHDGFELAALRTSVAGWRQSIEAAKEPAASQWREKTISLLRCGGERFGRGWSRRADRWLLSVSDQLVGEQGIAVDDRAAAELYLRGETESAIEMYDRAVAKANESENPARAFDLAFKAAAIAYEVGDLSAASQRFVVLARQNPQHPQAPRAQELAALATATLAADDPTRLADYRQQLEEIVEHWPRSSPAQNAHWWLARLSESQGEFSAATGHYKALAPSDSRRNAAVDAAGRCDLNGLRRMPAEAPDRGQRIRDAIAYYDDVAGSENSDAARLAAARLRTSVLDSQWQQAHQDLLTVAGRESDAPDGLRGDAMDLLVVTTAALGQDQAAERRLAQLTDRSPEDWLTLASRLARVARDDGDQRNVARLSLLALERSESQSDETEDTGEIDEGEIEDTQSTERMRLRARLLHRLDKSQDAVEIYGQLLERRPEDLKMRREFAMVLSSLDVHQWGTLALDQWRRIQKSSVGQSEIWFRARYEIAELTLGQGDRQRAREIVELTKALYPDLGGPDSASRFEDLLRRLGE